MAGYNLRPQPFGYPLVNPWPVGFQPIPPQAHPAPQQQQDPMAYAGGSGAPGGAPAPSGPMFPRLAERFPRLAQAGQAIRGFAENFDERFPRVGEFRSNNRDMLSNVGMALLTTRPGDNAPVREAFYMGRQSDQERRAQQTQAEQEAEANQIWAQFLGGGQPTPAGGAPVPTGTPGTGAEIVYANADATRNDPIAPALGTALQAAAAEAGIDRIVVFSGGQEAAGEGGERTGSSRHDHGNAADVGLYVGGRLLDFNNPEDQAIYQRFVQAAVANGVTGIGAGTDYMGSTRIHVGFGDPAVWGAGGSGANAPEWLRTAYGSGPQAGGGGQPPAPAGGQPQARFTPQEQAQLRAMLSNPQTAGIAQQIIAERMFTQPEPTTYGFEEVGGNLLRTDERAGTAETVFTAPNGGADAGAFQQTRNLLGPDGELHTYGFNPETNNYDRDQGRAPADAPLVAFNGDPIPGPLLQEAIDATGEAETLGVQVQELLLFRDLAGMTPTGFMENLTTGVRSALVSLGIIEDPNLPAQQVFTALQNQQALRLRNPESGFGLTGNTSNRDISFLTGAVANMANTPQANQAILTILLAKQRRAAALAALRADYIFETGNLAGYTEYKSRWIEENSIFTPEERTLLESLAAGTGAAAPATPTATPQALPNGVTQQQWDVMTPAERALFQ